MFHVEHFVNVESADKFLPKCLSQRKKIIKSGLHQNPALQCCAFRTMLPSSLRSP